MEVNKHALIYNEDFNLAISVSLLETPTIFHPSIHPSIYPSTHLFTHAPSHQCTGMKYLLGV